MNLKKRIDKIEKTLNASGGVRLEWNEPDENGNYPPVEPGTKVIVLNWEIESKNHKTAVADGKGSNSNE